MSSLPNLFLIGFMGVGKTSIGKVLSQELGLSFIDSDAAIEEMEGRSISDIFSGEGEAHFRQLERKFIEESISACGSLVSCGGGLVIPDGMMDLLKSKGMVIALCAKPETIYARTAKNTKRPLLNTENPEQRIRDLLTVRGPVYMQADVCISTDITPFPEIVEQVRKAYLRRINERR